jgi:hypothetical protein
MICGTANAAGLAPTAVLGPQGKIQPVAFALHGTQCRHHFGTPCCTTCCLTPGGRVGNVWREHLVYGEKLLGARRGPVYLPFSCDDARNPRIGTIKARSIGNSNGLFYWLCASTRCRATSPPFRQRPPRAPERHSPASPAHQLDRFAGSQQSAGTAVMAAGVEQQAACREQAGQCLQMRCHGGL